MMKGGIGNLMRQAQQMQENMQKAQAELAELEVTGEAGAGVVAAINDATRKLEARTKEKYAGLMSGMNLPPGMKLPF